MPLILRPTLVATCGLPRSGKSTFARLYCEERSVTHVCPDDVRLELHGQRFVYEAEEMVWTITKYMVRSLLRSGNPVLLDATNLDETSRLWLEKLNCKFFVFKTPSEVCQNRAIETGQPDLVPHIQRMNRTIVWPFPNKVIQYFEGDESLEQLMAVCTRP